MLRISDSGNVPSAEVLICGGGPVGLLLANLLGQAVDHQQDEDGVTVHGRHDGKEFSLRGMFLAGCDGHQSRVRRQSGLRQTSKSYRPRFMMADFEDRTEFGESAHLFFGRRGSVESFPLPGGMRRWIVLLRNTEWSADPLEVVRTHVFDQTGVDLHDLPHAGPSRFCPRRVLVRPYYRGRVALCGDAAHVMSPIGGQGMITGFADAELLASTLTHVLRDGEAAGPLFRAYLDVRTSSFRVASARAARGMWLGTRTGAIGSMFRRARITSILFRSSVRNSLPAYFAMLDLPFNTLDAARLRR